jgi:hypothetical protein
MLRLQGEGVLSRDSPRLSPPPTVVWPAMGTYAVPIERDELPDPAESCREVMLGREVTVLAPPTRPDNFGVVLRRNTASRDFTAGARVKVPFVVFVVEVFVRYRCITLRRTPSFFSPDVGVARYILFAEIYFCAIPSNILNRDGVDLLLRTCFPSVSG